MREGLFSLNVPSAPEPSSIQCTGMEQPDDLGGLGSLGSDRDLLQEWSKTRERAQRLRRQWATGFGIVLTLAIMAEPLLLRTCYLVLAVCVAMLVAAAIGLALLYEATIYYFTWSYAKMVCDKGQTRASGLQVLGIVILSSLSAVPVSTLAIRDSIDARFWMAFGIIAWSNLVAAFFGYASYFFHRSRV